MTSRLFWISGTLLVAVFLACGSLWAQSDGSEGRVGSATETARSVSVEPPQLRPITITFAGTLDSVSSTIRPPMIVVQDRYGVRKEMSVPNETEISQGNEAIQVADLVVGEKLTVEYTYDVATGKRTAQSILVGEETL